MDFACSADADDEGQHGTLLASLTTLSAFDRLHNVPELYSRFLDDCSWNLADKAFEFSLVGAIGSEGVRVDARRLLDFSFLSAKFVKPRERLMMAQEKLNFLHGGVSPLLVSSATLQYLLYSLQLSLTSSGLQRQVSSTLGSILASMGAFIRHKLAVDAQAAEENEDEENQCMDDDTRQEEEMGLFLPKKRKAKSMLAEDILCLLLRFACGMARGNNQWPEEEMKGMSPSFAAPTPSPHSVFSTNEGRVRDIIGFVLSVLATFVPFIENVSKRRYCVRLAVSVLIEELRIDPLYVLNHPERRRHVYWSTYTYLLKSQDPKSEPCREFGLYGSGLNAKYSKGTSVTGFERMIWGKCPQAGKSSHRELVQGFASACMSDTTGTLSSAERVSTTTGIARGAALVPMAALSDIGMDALMNELSMREETHANLSVVRRQAMKHGIFSKVPHAMLGCALVGHALLTQEMPKEGDTSNEYSVPALPQVYSFTYLHELCGGILPTLQHSGCAGANEPLELLKLMGWLVYGLERHSQQSQTMSNAIPSGYVFVPCLAVNPPPSPIPPGEDTSRVGIAAITSSLAAFIALQASYNYECIRRRLDVERERQKDAACTESGSAPKSAHTKSDVDDILLASRVEELLCLGVLSTKSCDVLEMVQTSISLIQHCSDESLARSAFSGLLRDLSLFEPRSLLLLLRKLVQECPFVSVTALLIDAAKSFVHASVRNTHTLIATSVSVAAMNFVPAEVSTADKEEAELLETIRKEQERKQEDAKDPEEEHRRREEENESQQELKVGDSVLRNSASWFSPLVLQSFSTPISALTEQSDSRVVSYLLQAGHLAAVESAVSLQTFIILKLCVAKRESGGSESPLLHAFFSSDSGSCSGREVVKSHRKDLLVAGKILGVAMKAANDNGKLQILAMNIDRLTELHTELNIV